MNILVIPEDFRKDEFMLRPLIRAMMRHIIARNVSIEICRDPLLGGISEALKWSRIAEIIQRYKYRIDLFILCVDRDGVPERRAALDHIERQAAKELPVHKLFVAEHAWQEIEVWVLAGLDIPNEWTWKEIRAELHPKERFFLTLSQLRGLQNEVADGREILAREAARRYDRIRQRCPEDVAALEGRIRDWVGGA